MSCTSPRTVPAMAFPMAGSRGVFSADCSEPRESLVAMADTSTLGMKYS